MRHYESEADPLGDRPSIQPSGSIDFLELRQGKIERRVLLCSALYYPNVGGVENSLYHLSATYRAAGVVPWILTSTGGDVSASGRLLEVRRMHGIPLIRYRHSRSALLRLVRAWLALRVITRKFTFDAIVCRDHYSAVACVAERRPCVYLVPGIAAEQNRPTTKNLLRWLNHFASVAIQRFSLGRAAQVAVFSGLMARSIEAGGFERKIHLVRPGVDDGRFKRAPADEISKGRSALGVPDDVKVAVIAGRLARQKRVDLAIEAVAKAPAEWWLLIVGDGPLRDELSACATRAGVGDRVVFLGKTSTPEEYLQLADVYILSSDYEPFGQVILEALACGLKIVAFDSDLPGVRTATNEIVPDRWLFKAKRKDADALRDALLEAGAAECVPEEISNWAHQRYSWFTLAADLIRLGAQRRDTVKGVARRGDDRRVGSSIPDVSKV